MVIAYWCLSHGYIAMLLSEQEHRTYVEFARVHDIVAYALVSLFAFRAGENIIEAMFLAAIPRTLDFTKNASNWAETWNEWYLVAAAGVLRPVTEVVALVRIATAMGERRVLGLRTNMGFVLFVAWAISIVDAMSHDAWPMLIKSHVKPRKARWFFLALYALLHVAAVFFYARSCWRQYRIATATDDAKIRSLQQSRVLSSRV